jgi:small subunit ribosomal protein S9
MIQQTPAITAVGRRKTATARVRLIPSGTGEIKINGRTLQEYCNHETLQNIVLLPFKTVEAIGQFDVIVIVSGGGPFGQVTAISHGISRALEKYNPEFRPALKKGGLLTRDPRMREREKSGQPGARKRFQFSKR